MAAAFVIVYYVIGIPLSLVLTYPAKLEMPGTWLSSALNAILIDICFFVILKRTDLSEELSKIHRRISTERESVTALKLNKAVMEL